MVGSQFRWWSREVMSMRLPTLTSNQRKDSVFQWSVILTQDRLYGEWLALKEYWSNRPYGPCPGCSEAWIPSGDRRCSKCTEAQR